MGMGYGLPFKASIQIENLHIVINSCESLILEIRTTTSHKRPIMTEEDSDSEIGPVLPGSKRVIGPSLPNSISHSNPFKLKQPESSLQKGGRETWMLEPGEHKILDFKSNKPRKFKNEKQNSIKKRPKFNSETQA